MLSEISGYLAYVFFGLARSSALGSSVEFFIYDSVKIVLILFLMVFFIGFLRTYVSALRVKALLSGRRRLLSYSVAACFGAVTPFCSCSSIPLFIGFMEAGVPLGAAFAFLVTSPLINEYLAVLMVGLFGWKIAAAYVLFGLLLGVASGYVVDRLGMRGEVVEGLSSLGGAAEEGFTGFRSRVAYGFAEAKSISSGMLPWVLAGVGVGAFIHGYVPGGALESAVSSVGVFSVPLAVLVGIPLYANCSSIVPVAVVLFQKGVPLGTALAFMMAVSGLSLPEAVILRRVLKVRLILVFFGIVGAGIVLVGYLFNALEPLLV